jgi:hypothetical protein
VTVGPSQRVGRILDLTAAPGERFEVVDRFYARSAYKLLDLVYTPRRLRSAPLADRVSLPPPELPDPDLAAAERHRFAI